MAHPSGADRANGAIPVGIVGISGYTGVELARLIASHPQLELAWTAANKAAGEPVDKSWPGLKGRVNLPIEAFSVERAAETCKAVFLAVPHGVAAQVAPALVEAGLVVIDLGADFRLRDPAVYRQFYGIEHANPAWIERAVYGLPEKNREALRGARLVANPGCYPTATALAVLPLVEAGLGGDLLIADCISGVSGAGRSPNARNLFCETTDAARAYSLAGTHRHVPEIEQTLGLPVVFTPHLAPMNRGMIATVHLRARATLAEVKALYAARYDAEPMVVLRDDPPGSNEVRGSNLAHVHVAVDERRGVITANCAIDNLVKGASGQAMQCLNLALGLEETAGIPLFPLLP